MNKCSSLVNSGFSKMESNSMDSNKKITLENVEMRPIFNNETECIFPFNKSLFAFATAEFENVTSSDSSISIVTSPHRYELFNKKYKDVVFIEDDLFVTIALSKEFISPIERGQIGKIWHDIKYDNNHDEIELLVDRLNLVITTYPFFRNIDNLFCFVPSSNASTSTSNVLSLLLDKIKISNDKINFIDLSWINKEKKLKYLTYAEKIKVLGDSEIRVGSSVVNKNIVLMDDLYQSGLTLKFVSDGLKKMGANNIYRLVLVKNPFNFDNYEGTYYHK